MLRKTNEATIVCDQKIKSLVERTGTIRPVSINFCIIKRNYFSLKIKSMFKLFSFKGLNITVIILNLRSHYQQKSCDYITALRFSITTRTLN